MSISNFFSFQKNKEINSYFFSKQFFLLLFNLLMFLSFAITIGIGFSQPYLNMIVSQVPINIQSSRAVSIFFLAWYLFSTVWLIKLGLEKSNKNGINVDVDCFAFIPFVSIILMINLTIHVGWKLFWSFIKQNFAPSNELRQLYSRKSPKYIVSCVICVLMFPVAIMVWMPEYVSNFGDSGFDLFNVWFFGIHYFTLQTNLLCVLFLVIFIIHPYFSIFKSNTFLVWCLSYIIIVSGTYNLGLLPINIFSGTTGAWTPYKWFKTMYEHVINPLLFLGYSLFIFFGTPNMKQRKYFTTLKFGMVIPTIYLFYALVLPFITTQSVYGIPTNCNPNLPNGSTFMPYGAWYMCFVIIAFWFLFVGVITGFYFLAKIKDKKEKTIQIENVSLVNETKEEIWHFQEVQNNESK